MEIRAFLLAVYKSVLILSRIGVVSDKPVSLGENY